NFNLKLRAIGRLTPFEAILDSYQKTPDLFITNPNHLIVGLNSYLISKMLQLSRHTGRDCRYPVHRNYEGPLSDILELSTKQRG
ncbi:MAG: hypothetical protein ACRESZ_02415, partial [Methylococcales bacterium]